MAAPTRRVAAFVDGSNIYFAMRETLGWQVDWRRFREFLEGFGSVTDCIYYVGLSDDPGQHKFLSMLAYSGYSLVTKDLKTQTGADGQPVQKANLDVEIAVDTLARAPTYECCVLVSGDGDLTRVVGFLRDQGKEVFVVSTAGRIAQELRWAAGPNFLDLDHYRAELERPAANPNPES